MTGTHHHIQLFSVEMGSHELFLPKRSWNHDPPNLSFLGSLRSQVWLTTPSYWLRWGLVNFLPVAGLKP
jgi:hypothetical protein